MPKRGVGALSTVSAFKECPRHVYSDLKPSKQIIGHKITESPVASKSSPDNTQHSELYDVTVNIL